MKKVKRCFHIIPLITLFIVNALCESVWAHQPVMDMAPRWKGGYGFQVRQELRFSDTLLDDDSEINNPLGRKRRVNTTWLEGIYTFKREVRASIKIPWIDQSRTMLRGGVPVKEESSGLGDIIIGMPLKRYQNEFSTTTNVAFTPSLRIPTGKTSGDFPLGDGSWDVNLSLSRSTEAAGLYQYYDLFYWINNKGKRGIEDGNQVGFDANIGIHPFHNNVTNSGVFLMMDVSARYQDSGHDTSGTTGGTRISIGPVLVLYRDNIMFRAEFKNPAYEKVFDTQVSYGSEVNVGVGITF